MTVLYMNDLATVSFAGLIKATLRWNGSVFKLLWKRLLICLIIFELLHVIYWFALNAEQQKVFVHVTTYCSENCGKIPVKFVLGFYVSNIFKRWWSKFLTIPWPTRMAMLVMSHVKGKSDEVKLIRRTLVWYSTLGFVLCMRSICPAVKLRFPTLTHVTEAGFMLPHEQEALEKIPVRTNKYFVPYIWATVILSSARQLGYIKNDHALLQLNTEINNTKLRCFDLFNMNWISMPLAYTQLAVFTVYVYTYGMLLGQQDTNDDVGMYFPFFAFLQFTFYHGWLKVGEMLMNPFGMTDDDIEVNCMIDAYLQTSYLIVGSDRIIPPQEKDIFWDVINIKIPHTVASIKGNKTLKRALEFAATSQKKVKELRVQMKKINKKHEQGFEEEEETLASLGWI